MKYLPLSPKDKTEMLEFVGAKTIDDLFASIPSDLKFRGSLNVPSAYSEMEIREHFENLAGKNKLLAARFLGAGVYAHFYPVIVDALSQRQEFLTSYTPYQPEISQGTLQYLFEFQTMITTLTGLDVSNASMYDGATAAAEAVLMASRLRKRRPRVLLSRALHPNYIKVIETYLSNLELHIQMVGQADGVTNVSELKENLDNDVCAFVVGYPNFNGIVEPLEQISEAVRASGAMTIAVTTEALSLALLKSPGSCNADLSVGEAQSFGNAPQYGGPHLGFFTCLDADKRQMPGRICGQTVDRQGKRAFVLTLNAREQHIRRAKATSNICSNEGLCALRATIYLSAMGKVGLRKLAIANHSKAVYLHKCLGAIDGVTVTNAAFFNEFVVRLPRPAKSVLKGMAEHGVQAGVDLGRFDERRDHEILVAVTELNTRKQLDAYVTALEGLL